jgi:hypothetical protein
LKPGFLCQGTPPGGYGTGRHCRPRCSGRCGSLVAAARRSRFFRPLLTPSPSPPTCSNNARLRLPLHPRSTLKRCGSRQAARRPPRPGASQHPHHGPR